jgi:CubicO group peptidase (beta-lactamase class C family)
MAGAPVRVQGDCQKRLERVRQVFEESFATGEVGAAVAVTLNGELVLDLWGGHLDGARTRPWQRDSLANVYSTTKGMTAICANRLIEQGVLDVDAPVTTYWPEFGQQGKGAIPVRWLLCHRAGVPALRKQIPSGGLYDWKFMTESLAAEAPFWEPGTAHGYHALTYGYLVGEVLRRIDGRTLGNYFREELGQPLGLDFHIGTGPELDARCAEILPAPAGPPDVPNPFAAAAKDPESLVGRVFANPALTPGTVNTRAWRAAEIPAGNGHGTARGLARIYGALSTDGKLDGRHVLSPAQIAKANTENAYGQDKVLSPLPSRFGLGFMMTQPMIPFGPNPRTFGHPGAGGSIAFADPDAKLGFAYVMNQMQVGLGGDARGFRLIAEVYAALQ